MDWPRVQTEFETLVANEETKEEAETIRFDSVVYGTTDELEMKFSKARSYAQRLDTTIASSSDGHIFINGRYYIADDVCCHALVLRCRIKL